MAEVNKRPVENHGWYEIKYDGFSSTTWLCDDCVVQLGTDCIGLWGSEPPNDLECEICKDDYGVAMYRYSGGIY